MNEGYVKVGEVSQDTRARAIVICRNLEKGWQPSVGPGRNYDANMEGREALAELTELTDRWPVEQWQSAFFLKIPPGGEVHKHTDAPHPWSTYHVVLLTNDACINFMYDEDDKEIAYFLEPGNIYRVDRSIPHGSVNRGETERLHLLMEIRDG